MRSLKQQFRHQLNILVNGHIKLIMITLLAIAHTGCENRPEERSGHVHSQVKTKSVSSSEAGDTKPARAHLAFAGGGWRAHTGHSAWVMSLLEKQNSLDKAFANVGAISSNSGGSWFNTMLAYSPSFARSIEAPNALGSWATPGPNASGWLGQQQTLFNEVKACKHVSGAVYLACVFDHYTGSLKNATYWHKVVEKLVFHNNPIEQTLAGKRNAWAQNKTLLLASSMLTTNAVLSQAHLIEKQYYQACITPSKPSLDGSNGATCTTPSNKADVTPVSFTSLPNNSTDKPLPFLRALNTKTSSFNLGYTENALLSAPQYFSSLSNPQQHTQVPVMIAAAASSAAAGFAASETVSGHWEASYLASDEALNFKLDGNVEHIIANGMTAKQLADQKVVQIADGGAVDNSAVAQLVSYLQLNNKADDFNIIAFDNVQQAFTPTCKNEAACNGANVGGDIANLFGQGLKNGTQTCSGSFCVTTPDLRIFELASLISTPATWSAKTDITSSTAGRIIYTKYSVTTADNTDFGIHSGTQGTLHAFTAVWPSADTAPTKNKGNADFKSYAEMLTFINSALKRKGPNGMTGLSFLESAFSGS